MRSTAAFLRSRLCGWVRYKTLFGWMDFGYKDAWIGKKTEAWSVRIANRNSVLQSHLVFG
jgi:hypothetical protein